MKNTMQTKLTLLVVLFLLLAGCNQSSVNTPTKTSSTEIPSRVFTIDNSPIAKSELVPMDVAQLAFTIYGRVRSTNVKIGDVVQEGDVLVQLETVMLNADVSRAENALQAAQGELKLLESQRAKQVNKDIATARIGMAEADLISARYMLTQSTLAAPFDGTVVDMQVMPGETVSAGETVITLADLQSLQVETLDLSERDLPRIYVGQRTEVNIEALDILVDGVVDNIASQATIAGEDRVYKVVIKLTSQPKGLRWGMGAETRFILNE